MSLEDMFGSVPDDDDLLYSIEHWSETDVAESDGVHSDRIREAFVHPRTGTAARIIEGSDGTYSVQPSMGDFGPYDCVVQSEDPSSFVSGGASVVATGLVSVSEARAMAYAWIRGWVMRNSNIPESEGGVRDSERTGTVPGA